MSLKKIALAALPLILFYSSANCAESLDPGKTYAVITGVLAWEDSANLASYPAEGRKDAELHKTLLQTGVPVENMVLLLDKEATRANILKAIEETGKKAEKGSLFIFYYAGHGLNHPGEGRFFANYDINTSSAPLTGLSENDLFRVISKNFRKKKVLLTADCCYSGFLGELAEKLNKKGVLAASATSASKSNTSTGNWTFSQTLLAALRGNPLADSDGDGLITLPELADETNDAMRYVEKQLSGSYIPAKLRDFVLTGVSEKRGPKACGKFETGEYVFDKEGNTVRIKSCDGEKIEIESLSYSGKDLKTAPAGELKKIVFKTWPAGSLVKVTWEGKVYDAKILEERNGFHLITYPGWDSSWDEWVMEDRIAGKSSGTE